MPKNKRPPEPTHVSGMHRGEELALTNREPGRQSAKSHRTARDSTSINPEDEMPIHPAMPNIPPA